MRIGVVFPQTEIGHDPAVIRDYAQTAEDLGFLHVLAYDHVIGANPASRAGWRPPYTHLDTFHEPWVLFGHLAALTKKIELVTGVVILPQRQTVLVAKQAEQVEVLRRLWTQELVTFTGRWHTVADAGINPLPVQRPIPIWFGGSHDRALRRLARLGDGWFPLLGPDEKCRAMIETIGKYARAAGRDPSAIGIEGTISYGQGSPDAWLRDLDAWRNLGATHVSFNTMKAGLASPAAHIEALRRFQTATASTW